MRISGGSIRSGLGALVFVALFPTASGAEDGDWILAKVATTNVCHVQKAVERPYLGTVVGNYPTRAAACNGAAAKADAAMDNADGCWAFGSGTKAICAQEGVSLP